MVYDVTMLEAFYAAYKGKVEHVRAILKRPLTLAEKILYAHLYDVADLKDYKRGEDYVNFRPDRVYAGCNCADGFASIYECYFSIYQSSSSSSISVAAGLPPPLAYLLGLIL